GRACRYRDSSASRSVGGSGRVPYRAVSLYGYARFERYLSEERDGNRRNPVSTQNLLEISEYFMRVPQLYVAVRDKAVVSISANRDDLNIIGETTCSVGALHIEDISYAASTSEVLAAQPKVFLVWIVPHGYRKGRAAQAYHDIW